MTFLTKIKELVGLGLANTTSSLIYAFFWLFLASLLAKTEYGELGFLMSIANVGTAISLIGLRATVVVYESKKENIFFTSFLLVFISSSLTAVASYLLSNSVIVSVLIIGMALFAIIQSGLNGKQEYKKFSKNLLIRSFITVVAALFFYQMFGLEGILLGYFLATLIFINDLLHLAKNQKIDLNVIKTKINFMLNTYGTRLANVIFRWGDKLLICVLFGFSFLGSYYFAAQYLLLLTTLPRAINQFLVPEESKGKGNKKIKIFSVTISIMISILSIFLIPIGVNSLLPQYEESIIPMQILSIALVPITISMIQQSEFLGREHSRIVLLGAVFESVIYLVLIFTLGPIYELFGIALGFLIASIFRNIFNFINKIKNL